MMQMASRGRQTGCTRGEAQEGAFWNVRFGAGARNASLFVLRFELIVFVSVYVCPVRVLCQTSCFV
jgi:hypothetical protein